MFEEESCGCECVQVGQSVPDFKAQAVLGNDEIKEISLSDYRGKYVVLFFYPLDFTFVCPTEILAFNRSLSDFKNRNAELIGISVDSVNAHWAWKQMPIEKGGIGAIQYPLVADLTKEISLAYNVLLEQGISARGLFIIDREGVLQSYTVNNLPLGRNVSEALRMLDAIQHVEVHGEVCPANWTKGQEAMSATPDGVSRYLSKNK